MFLCLQNWQGKKLLGESAWRQCLVALQIRCEGLLILRATKVALIIIGTRTFHFLVCTRGILGTHAVEIVFDPSRPITKVRGKIQVGGGAILGASYNGEWLGAHIVPEVQFEVLDVPRAVVRLDWIGYHRLVHSEKRTERNAWSGSVIVQDDKQTSEDVGGGTFDDGRNGCRSGRVWSS
jgi:hypothetical protein